MSQEVIILKGLPGSGKSTYARELVDKNPGKYKRINKDDLRAMLDNSRWSKGNEKFILEMRDLIITSALSDNYSVIVDDTNLIGKHEERIREIVKFHNDLHKSRKTPIKVIVVDEPFVSVPIEECIARDLKRPNSVGEAVIRKMAKEAGLVGPTTQPLEKYSRPDLPSCIICDLDGTMALLNGRNPYDPVTIMTDGLNEPVAETVRKLMKDHFVFFFSGRKEKYREETVNWLNTHGFHFKGWSELRMRANGDDRKDSVVKREMFDAAIRNRYNVLLVLDDRDQVVDLWRNELGLTCFQVAEGDF